MILTGNNKSYNFFNSSGFTLVEIMVTVAILSIGIVGIFQSLFVNLDALSYYTNYLKVQNWMNEKIWQVREGLINEKLNKIGANNGSFVKEGKKFNWNLSINSVIRKMGLYELNLTISWYEGEREVNLSRTTYILPPSESKKK